MCNLANSKTTKLIVIMLGINFHIDYITCFEVHKEVRNWTFSAHLLRNARSTHAKHGRQICIGCEDTNTNHCSRKLMIRVKRYSERLKCQPENTLVKIQEPGPSYSVEPALAKVKRCKGYCRAGYHSCLPTETSFVKIPAILTNHATGHAKCVEYEIEQHENCACSCKILKEHCSEKHEHEMCSCRCKNENKKYKCLENVKATWDEDDCKCSCEADAEDCSTGHVWNSEACRCETISPDDLENMLY